MLAEKTCLFYTCLSMSTRPLGDSWGLVDTERIPRFTRVQSKYRASRDPASTVSTDC